MQRRSLQTSGATAWKKVLLLSSRGCRRLADLCRENQVLQGPPQTHECLLHAVQLLLNVRGDGLDLCTQLLLNLVPAVTPEHAQALQNQHQHTHTTQQLCRHMARLCLQADIPEQSAEGAAPAACTSRMRRTGMAGAQVLGLQTTLHRQDRQAERYLQVDAVIIGDQVDSQA